MCDFQVKIDLVKAALLRGLGVLKYRDKAAKPDLQEVGAHTDPAGNNFWGVEVHKHPNGQKYVLASDRDSGVWLFQYTGK